MNVREQIAKLGYQYSELIDDKDIDKRWYNLLTREKWFDMADQILSLKYPNGQPKVGIIKENQSCECTIDNFADFTPEAAYRRGKEDMRDANFKRIEVEG